MVENWEEANKIMSCIAGIVVLMIGCMVILTLSTDFERSAEIQAACESYGYDNEIVRKLGC